MKRIDVDRKNKKTNSPNLRVATSEEVSWTMLDLKTDERLVLNSSLIKVIGKVNFTTLTVTIPVVAVTYDLDYEICVQTVPPPAAPPSPEVPVVSDKLVIDTIGPPKSCMEYGDEPVEEDYECEEQN